MLPTIRPATKERSDMNPEFEFCANALSRDITKSEISAVGPPTIPYVGYLTDHLYHSKVLGVPRMPRFSALFDISRSDIAPKGDKGVVMIDTELSDGYHQRFFEQLQAHHLFELKFDPMKDFPEGPWKATIFDSCYGLRSIKMSNRRKAAKMTRSNRGNRDLVKAAISKTGFNGKRPTTKQKQMLKTFLPFIHEAF